MVGCAGEGRCGILCHRPDDERASAGVDGDSAGDCEIPGEPAEESNGTNDNGSEGG